MVLGRGQATACPLCGGLGIWLLTYIRACGFPTKFAQRTPRLAVDSFANTSSWPQATCCFLEATRSLEAPDCAGGQGQAGAVSRNVTAPPLLVESQHFLNKPQQEGGGGLVPTTKGSVLGLGCAFGNLLDGGLNPHP